MRRINKEWSKSPLAALVAASVAGLAFIALPAAAEEVVPIERDYTATCSYVGDVYTAHYSPSFDPGVSGAYVILQPGGEGFIQDSAKTFTGTSIDFELAEFAGTTMETENSLEIRTVYTGEGEGPEFTGPEVLVDLSTCTDLTPTITTVVVEQPVVGCIPGQKNDNVTVSDPPEGVTVAISSEWVTAPHGEATKIVTVTLAENTVHGEGSYTGGLVYDNGGNCGINPTPTPTPTITPTVKPTPTVTPTVKPTPTVSPTVKPTVTPTVRPNDGSWVYVTPGYHSVNGRQWHTTCESYSQTVRCRTEIWSTQVFYYKSHFVKHVGWHFNNLTYLPYMTRAQWASNPLGHTGSWTSVEGRQWRTECDTAASGGNGCRSSIYATYVKAWKNEAGVWCYATTRGWVFNNIVRFKA